MISWWTSSWFTDHNSNYCGMKREKKSTLISQEYSTASLPQAQILFLGVGSGVRLFQTVLRWSRAIPSNTPRVAQKAQWCQESNTRLHTCKTYIYVLSL